MLLKNIAFLQFLVCMLYTQSLHSQTSSLYLYSYKDVWVVFPEFCVEDFYHREFDLFVYDTVNGIGIDIDAIPPYILFQSGNYPPINPFFKQFKNSLDFYEQNSPFSNFTININVKNESSTSAILSIGKIELWHKPPVIQKVYPLSIADVMGKDLKGDELLAILSVFYIYDYGELETSKFVGVNIFKIINKVNFPDLVAWANEMSSKVDFYPNNCPDTTLDFLNYNPCNWSKTE